MTLASTILLASIPALLMLYASRWKKLDQDNSFPNNPPDFNLPVKIKYDFIIVGGGTAGLILANKLSEKFSVLVLEAGGHPPPLIAVPGIAAENSVVPGINFLYRSTPQSFAGMENGRFVPITAGKMLGGSSSHNFLVWEHGHADDYNRWAYITKDPSWRYENLLKYFRHIEYLRTISSTTGSINTQSVLSLGQDVWFDAGLQLGYPIRDPQSPQTVGFNPIVYSTSSGLRSSSYTLFLQPILNEPWRRLKISKYSVVSRVLFDGRTAIGVEYKKHGVTRVAFATKEVILSAGTFISPIILFKSGIGPKDQVRDAKAYSHILDLPVGLNLHDHPVVPIDSILVPDPTLTWSIQRNLSYYDIDLFTKKGLGPLTTPYHGTEAFVRSEPIKTGQFGLDGPRKGMSGWPDLQIIYNPTGAIHNSITCMVSNSQPLSRGVLGINSSAVSMEDDNLPLLNYKYFHHPRDLEVTLAGIQFCLTVFEETLPFQKVGTKLSPRPYKPCRMFPFRSTDYWLCYIRYRATTGYHSSGTCRMGHGVKDFKAVVDSKLRVISVRGLRVVDASIMPYVTNANTMAPTMVIALKAAEDILEQYSPTIVRGK